MDGESPSQAIPVSTRKQTCRYAQRPTSMNTEDVIVYHHAQREVVKHVREMMPHIGVAIFAAALSVETVALRDTAGFVVAANEMHS
jgi:hypothetical protein